MALFARNGSAASAAPTQFSTADMYVPPSAEALQAAKPRRVRNRFLPVWHVIFFIYFVFLVRILAMAHMGAAAYETRVNALSQGNGIERATAIVMYMDPVSANLGRDLRVAIKSWSAYAAEGNWRTRARERNF